MTDFLQAALAHAKSRWCWDDPSFIEELLTNEPPEQGVSPEQWIDAQAIDFDLTDPKADWGVLA